MDADAVKALLEQVRSGQVNVDRAVEELRKLPAAELGYATVDHHRALRQGVPEVVFGEGKSVEQIVGIARELMRRGGSVMVTRVEADKAEHVRREVPELDYHALGRVLTWMRETPQPPQGISPVAVVTAGTSDIPVAEEALHTLRLCRVAAEPVFDVGVAGIHRVVRHLDMLSQAPAAIVVAGMEGALASVVGGLLSTPIVAVPTSIGYGAALGGFTPLMGMLTGCASGVTVVNIDNGFGAAMAVVRIVRSLGRSSFDTQVDIEVPK